MALDAEDPVLVACDLEILSVEGGFELSLLLVVYVQLTIRPAHNQLLSVLRIVSTSQTYIVISVCVILTNDFVLGQMVVNNLAV